MRPIKFKESNVVYGDHQKEYLPLPAYKEGDGRVITCWQLSLKERIKLLFSGTIWHETLTFNNPLQPVMFHTDKPEIFNKKINNHDKGIF